MLAQIGTNKSPMLANVGRIWPIFGKTRQTSAKLDQHRTSLVEFEPNLGAGINLSTTVGQLFGTC